MQRLEHFLVTSLWALLVVGLWAWASTACLEPEYPIFWFMVLPLVVTAGFASAYAVDRPEPVRAVMGGAALVGSAGMLASLRGPGMPTIGEILILLWGIPCAWLFATALLRESFLGWTGWPLRLLGTCLMGGTCALAVLHGSRVFDGSRVDAVIAAHACVLALAVAPRGLGRAR